MSYYDVYLARLNRFGQDYQSRIQNKREYDFDNYLLKSVYRVDFRYNDKEYAAALEPNKQDNSETLHYLLTRVPDTFEPGTVLTIEGKRWMIYWLEEVAARGYNRYVVLKMTHLVQWTNRKGEECELIGYLYWHKNGAFRETMRAFPGAPYYPLDDNASSFITPLSYNIFKDDYIEIGEGDGLECYRVLGIDRQSTRGVQFVTLDPINKRDTSKIEIPEENVTDDYYWLQGDK